MSSFWPDRFVTNAGIWISSFWVTNRGNVTWTTIGSFTVTSASARPTRVGVVTTAITRTWPRYEGIWNGTVILPSAPTGTTPDHSATGLLGWTLPLPYAPCSASAMPPSQPPVFDDAQTGLCSIDQPIVSNVSTPGARGAGGARGGAGGGGRGGGN